MSPASIRRRHLTFALVAPGLPYHAANFATAAGRGAEFEEHGQYFYDFMYVARGGGIHRANGIVQQLRAGDISLVRPGDVHSLRVPPSGELHFFNVAFPADAWGKFGRLADVEQLLGDWDANQTPPILTLASHQRTHCERLCATLVEAYRAGPRALEICRFWTTILGWLAPGDVVAGSVRSVPDWLGRAVESMETEDNMRRGLPRFLELAHVSHPHLCRSVGAAYGVSPTEMISRMRLRRATLLLSETDRDVAAIGVQCGFDNASYFHRCFKVRYGLTPRAYRLRARSTVF